MSVNVSEDERVEILYVRPRYTSETAPDLPQELFDAIARLLKDDLISLYNCLRTCRAWYHAARRYLVLGGQYSVFDAEGLEHISRALAANTRRFYGDKLTSLFIIEDRIRPLAYTFPFRIPGSDLPKVTAIDVRGVDWEEHRPHSKFFVHLSRFTAVTRLFLEQCHFHCSRDLFDLIRSLRCLKEVSLNGIMTEKWTVQMPVTHPNLHNVLMQGLATDMTHKIVSTLCYMFPQDRPGEFRIFGNCFTSLNELQSIICAIPTQVDVVVVISGPAWWNPAQEISLNPPLVPYALWTTLLICDIWGTDGFFPVVQELLSIAPSSLENLEIQKEAGSQTLSEQEWLQLQGHMQRLGPSLKTFVWLDSACMLINKPDYNLMLSTVNYLPPLTMCTMLEKLRIHLWIRNETRMLHKTCNFMASILTQIRSPRLTRFELALYIQSHASDADSAETEVLTSTCFQHILSHDTFKYLPTQSVMISISIYQSSSTAQKIIADATYAVIPPLFTHWLTCGTLTLKPPIPGDEYSTYTYTLPTVGDSPVHIDCESPAESGVSGDNCTVEQQAIVNGNKEAVNFAISTTSAA